jgi:hypothetical protein
MKKNILNISILLLIFSLNGCSSKEDSQIKSFAKCSIVAEQLGDYKSKKNLENKMGIYMKNNVDYFKSINNLSAYFMKLTEEVRNDDIGLYKYNTRGKMKILQELYNSDECKELYK